MKKAFITGMLVILMSSVILAGCGDTEEIPDRLSDIEPTTVQESASTADAEETAEEAKPDEAVKDGTVTDETVSEEPMMETATEELVNDYVIVIDAGHQQKGNSEKRHARANTVRGQTASTKSVHGRAKLARISRHVIGHRKRWMTAHGTS